LLSHPINPIKQMIGKASFFSNLPTL